MTSTPDYQAVLKQAEDKVGLCDFVASCQAFFKKTGFLTPKQIKALENVKKPRSLRSAYYGYYDEEGHWENLAADGLPNQS